jgi:hypothetical protein
MKRFVFLLAACLLSSASHAQMPVTTKQECNRRCMTIAKELPQWAKHQEKLKQIGDKKKAETDPAKLKQLAKEADDEIDRFNDEHEKVCCSICEHNPEE